MCRELDLSLAGGAAATVGNPNFIRPNDPQQRGISQYWATRVQCQGSETALAACPLLRPTGGLCPTNNRAGVRCSVATAAAANPLLNAPVRLMQGELDTSDTGAGLVLFRNDGDYK